MPAALRGPAAQQTFASQSEKLWHLWSQQQDMFKAHAVDIEVQNLSLNRFMQCQASMEARDSMAAISMSFCSQINGIGPAEEWACIILQKQAWQSICYHAHLA